MKVLFSLLILVSFSFIVFADDKASFYHEVPVNVIQGEIAHFEFFVNNIHAENSDINEVKLFYRPMGSDQYNSRSMKEEGFSYSTELNTSNMNSGQIEYYFAFRDRRGGVGMLPAESPQLNPYVMAIAPAQTQGQSSNFEIIVLSPDLNESIPDDEVLIAASVLGGESDIDFDQSRLLIDGVNVTALADFSDGIITFAPENIRIGRHNIELQIYNNDGELIQNREWAFRAIQSGGKSAKVNYRGSFFVDNRNQNISDVDDNFFRGGGYFAGNYKNFDFYTRLIFSSEESENLQPINRYTAELRYNFSDRNNIYLNGGDITPYYNPLILQDKRVRGIQTGLALGLFTFDYLYGQTKRGVEGSQEITVTNDTSTVNGVYSENIMAFRPGFRFGDNVHWNLNLINSKENEESIEFGGNVKEALVVGTDLNMNFDNRRIVFESSFQASIQNSDAGGPELEWEDLVKVDSSLEGNSGAKSAFDILKSTGFLSTTAGLNPLPNFAMQFDLYLRYFQNNLKFTYLDINSDFASPGNPYLLKDIIGFYIFDNIRLFQNQVFLNLFYKTYKNNLSDDQYSTDNSELGTTISYFPQGNYPSLTLGYTSYNRSNGVSEADTAAMPYLYIEDNSTQQINFSSSYDIYLNKIRNTLLFNITNFIRDDIGNKESKSDFSSFTIGFRTKFEFPLTTKLSFTQSKTEIGDLQKSITDVNRYNAYFEYRLYDVFDADVLKPYLNVTLQNISAGSGTTSTSRNNYSTGVVYQSKTYGVFSLKYYQVSYSVPDVNNPNSTVNVDDTILNARYEYLF
ncbi:hypothetical protein ACFLSX_05075 [Calditrichota bacterium]